MSVVEKGRAGGGGEGSGAGGGGGGMVAALAAARVAEALVVEKMAAKEAAGQGR